VTGGFRRRVQTGNQATGNVSRYGGHAKVPYNGPFLCTPFKWRLETDMPVGFFQDLRYGVGMLRRHRGFSAVALVSLALSASMGIRSSRPALRAAKPG